MIRAHSLILLAIQESAEMSQFYGALLNQLQSELTVDTLEGKSKDFLRKLWSSKSFGRGATQKNQLQRNVSRFGLSLKLNCPKNRLYETAAR